MPKKDGELNDEELEIVVGGSKDMKVLFENWRRHVKEDLDLKVGSFEHPHQNLNESLWDENDQLKLEVKEKLLEIARKFISKTQGADAEIKDITFTGSLANYNYSMLSDIDLHILIAFEELNEDVDLVKDYFNAVKALWNYLHDIRIKGYEVEVYVQNATEPHVSSGVYSIMNDEWVKTPTREEPQIDQDSITRKAESLMDQIDRALALMEKDKYEEAHDRAIKIRNKIKRFRQAGLESAGEYSVENLAFKTLRNNGYLGKLTNLKRDAYDAMMSLDEKKKKKKACKPSKGKRFAKRVDGKCRSFGQAGKAKGGGDRIRPGTAKGDAYCARSAKIKKCKNPPCANTLSRKKWKCRGKKSMAEDLKLTESQLYEIVKKELIKEFSLTGIDVPRIVSLRRPVKKRSKAKDQVQRIETDLHSTQDAVDRLEEYTREIYNMLIKIIRKNK